MREHVAALVGPEHLPGLVALLDDPRRLAGLDLPDECVVKSTHGSGACVVVSRAAPEDTRLPPPEHGWVCAHVRPEVPADHKLFVFSGRCHFVQVDAGRSGEHTQDFLDRAWTWLPLTGGHPRSAPWTVPRRYR